MNYSVRVMFSTALLSVALIGFQIAMLQILSISQWHHFASMVVSVALLGFGAAGTTLSLWREALLAHSKWLLPALTLISGAAMVGAVQLSQLKIARFDSYLLFVNSSQWFSLMITYLLYLLPFYLGALALGIIFVRYANEIGRFYFVNLVGSGLGGLVSVFVAWYFIPSALPAFFGLMTFTAGMGLLSSEKKWSLLLTGLAAFTFEIVRLINPIALSSSEYKSVDRALNLPNAVIEIEKPSPFGLIQVVSAEGLRHAPGISLAFASEIPVKKVVFNNGEWVGHVISQRSYDSVPFLDYTTMNLPYVLKERESVVILHASTGLHVTQALHQHAQKIHAVEPNQALVHLLKNKMASETDSLFHLPQVELVAAEPRTFISTSKEKFDLINLPIIGTFGGSMGLYSMREEYSLTTEAFLEMYNTLKDDGVICVTAWMDYPFRNPLKVTSTLFDVLNAAKKDVSNHLLAIRGWGTVTFLMGKSAFTPDEISRMRVFCDSMLFDPLLVPGIRADERMNYNMIHDTTFFDYIDKLVSGHADDLFSSYDFNLRSSTDNKPYFSQFLKWNSVSHLGEIFGTQSVPFFEMGFIISSVTFVQLSVLAVVLIILPLVRRREASPWRLWTLLYFSGLGVGYMLLEIVMIQRFILLFSTAVYSVAWVMSIMLISSGIGSYFSSRISRKFSNWLVVLLTVFLLLVLYSIFLTRLLPVVATLSLPFKLLVSFIIISIPAFLMGIPFPAGISFISSRDQAMVPWAWAVNGCVSVMSASGAAVLAVEFGFASVTWLSSMGYLLVLLSTFFVMRSKLARR